MRELEFDGIIIGAGPNRLTTYTAPVEKQCLKRQSLGRIWECLSRT